MQQPLDRVRRDPTLTKARRREHIRWVGISPKLIPSSMTLGSDGQTAACATPTAKNTSLLGDSAHGGGGRVDRPAQRPGRALLCPGRRSASLAWLLRIGLGMLRRVDFNAGEGPSGLGADDRIELGSEDERGRGDVEIGH